MKNEHPRLGFIGTGGIVEAMIVGLLTHGDYGGNLVISERSLHRSRMLSERFNQVQVEPNNQTIVDQSEWVFIGVLPEQTVDLLNDLTFREDHRVISLSAGIELASIKASIMPATRCHRAIPMPPIELGVGPVVVCPPDMEVESFFSRVGTVVAVNDENQFTAFSASSAIMASYFEMTASMARWLENQNVPKEESARYATSILHALSCMTTQASSSELQTMSQDCLTIGGLNEQVLNELKQLGWFDQLVAAWDRILKRLQK